MGFLKKLFGGQDKKSSAPYVDTRGVYLYAQCGFCGTIVRVRADKEYDLERTDRGYIWNKTIVDSRCFRRMPTTVVFDEEFQVVAAEISGGEYVTELEYLESLQAAQRQPESSDDDEPADGEGH